MSLRLIDGRPSLAAISFARGLRWSESNVAKWGVRMPLLHFGLVALGALVGADDLGRIRNRRTVIWFLGG